MDCLKVTARRRQSILSAVLSWSLALTQLFLIAACAQGPGDGKVPVTVEKVLVEEKQADLSLPAMLEPANKAVYTFPMEVKIEEAAVRLGEVVSQGSPLFKLDALDLSLKMAALKAKRQEVRSGLDKNRYFLENRERLLEEGKIDRTQYDALEMEVGKAQAEFDRLDAEIAQIEKEIGEAAVRAPFSGVVSTLEAAAGTRVPAGQNILTLVQIHPMAVAFRLPAAESGGISVEMPVEVEVEGFSGQTFSAAITFIAPELNPGDRTLDVKAGLPNRTYTFKGGMPAQVRLTSRRSQKVLSIPARAVLKEGEKESVFIIRQNKAWPVRIYTRPDPGRTDFLFVERGLNENDLVVVDGQQKLSAGSEVNLWR